MKRAKQIFPRPIRGPLRPIVHCPTQRYNMKTRRGKGVSFLRYSDHHFSTRLIQAFLCVCPLLIWALCSQDSRSWS